MPFIFKTDALLDAVAGEQIEITEPAYYGGRAVFRGAEAFIWFSGTVQGLAWSAEVLRVDPPIGRLIPALVRLIDPAFPGAPGIAELMPFRDVRDGTALSGLSCKIYRHAHDKVAELTTEEANLLRSYFA
ncbi:MAG TPA: hypothetical protein VGM07_00860 [Stellaceae bacterium]|jgi:hypothetical protein